MLFCLLGMYVSIISNPAYTPAASAEDYSHFLSPRRRGICPISHRNIWFWNPTRTRPMQGITTHVSAPKSNTD